MLVRNFLDHDYKDTEATKRRRLDTGDERSDLTRGALEYTGTTKADVTLSYSRSAWWNKPSAQFNSSTIKFDSAKAGGLPDPMAPISTAVVCL